MRLDLSQYNQRLFQGKEAACKAVPFMQRSIRPMIFTPTNEVDTMAVDKYGRGYLNPSFAALCNPKELGYGIVHERLHCELLHAYRREILHPICTKEQALICNIAADMCIQQMLAEETMLPNAAILEPKDIVRVEDFQKLYPNAGFVRNLTMEQYVGILTRVRKQDEEEKQRQPQTPQDSDDGEDTENNAEDGSSEPKEADDASGSGNCHPGKSSKGAKSGSGESGESTEDSDWPSLPKSGLCSPKDTGSNCGGETKDYELPVTLADLAKHDAQQKELAQELQAQEDNYSTNIGKIAGCVRQSLAIKFGAGKDPFAILASVVRTATSSNKGATSRTFKKPSRLILPNDGKLRGRTRSLPNCTVVVDTSGSMQSWNAQDEALTVIAKAIRHLRSPRIICADTEMQASKRYSAFKQFEWVGGGGTDMGVAVTDAYKADKPSVIVLITDGLTPWPEKLGCKLIIALVGNKLSASNRKDVPKWARVVDCQTDKSTNRRDR